MLISSGERPTRPTEGESGGADVPAIDLSGSKGQRGGRRVMPAAFFIGNLELEHGIENTAIR